MKDHKQHYAVSNSELREGASVKAMCGKPIYDVKFAAAINLRMAGDKFTAVPAHGLCRRCFAKDWDDYRFLYVIA